MITLNFANASYDKIFDYFKLNMRAIMMEE
jgi:hypothetical protein